LKLCGPPERLAPTRAPQASRLQVDLGSGEFRAIGKLVRPDRA